MRFSTLAVVLVCSATALAGGPRRGPQALAIANGGAHVINIQTVGGNTGFVTWSGSTVTFMYNDAVNNLPAIPNVEAGSTPQAAGDAGAQAWEDASVFDFVDGGTTAVTDVGTDGINLFTFQNTAANTAAVGGALAITLSSFNSSLNFTEADIVFNPAFTFSTLGTAGFYDIQSIACHEYGHAFGLNHSAVCSSTMYPFSGTAETHQRTLSTDDVAGINGLYPSIPHFWATGVITGTVMRNSAVVYGAHVVARSLVDGVTVAAAMSKPDGTYELSGLPAGPYVIYAEPLDGPVGDSNVTSSFYTTGKDTTFQTTFLGSTASPTPVNVTPASVTSSVDLTLPAANSTLNLTFANEVAGPGMGFSANGGGFELAPGANTFVIVAGPSVSTTADSAFSMTGAGITFGPSSVESGTLGSVTYKMFPVVVAADAPPGPRDIVMDTGSEVTVYCGVVDIQPAGTPTASVFTYGTASGGSAGSPDLASVGLPTLGNTGFGVTVTNGVSGENAFFFVAGEPDYVDTGNGLVQWIAIDRANVFPGVVLQQPIVANSATLVMGVPNIPGLAGYKVYVQALLSDALNPGGASSTNALVLTLN